MDKFIFHSEHLLNFKRIYSFIRNFKRQFKCDYYVRGFFVGFYVNFYIYIYLLNNNNNASINY